MTRSTSLIAWAVTDGRSLWRHHEGKKCLLCHKSLSWHYPCEHGEGKRTDWYEWKWIKLTGTGKIIYRRCLSSVTCSSFSHFLPLILPQNLKGRVFQHSSEHESTSIYVRCVGVWGCVCVEAVFRGITLHFCPTLTHQSYATADSHCPWPV